MAARIEAEQKAGTIAATLDPGESGWALILMNERYLSHAMGRNPRPDVDTIVRSLS